MSGVITCNNLESNQVLVMTLQSWLGLQPVQVLYIGPQIPVPDHRCLSCTLNNYVCASWGRLAQGEGGERTAEQRQIRILWVGEDGMLCELEPGCGWTGQSTTGHILVSLALYWASLLPTGQPGIILGFNMMGKQIATWGNQPRVRGKYPLIPSCTPSSTFL